MFELDRALELCLKPPAAARAVDSLRAQAKAWTMGLPPAEPLVLDFGLGDFPRFGLIECWIANEAEAGYAAKYLFVLDGQTCPAHLHRRKHETFFVVRGEVVMFFDEAEHHLRPGDAVAIEPGKYHRFTGLGPALLLEVSTPCTIDDNFFQNPAIPIGPNWQGDPSADRRR
jgi:D-lyxose ketol-isomerase